MARWLIAIAAALALTSCARAGPVREAVDRVVIDKEARRLTLFSNGRALRSYRVALGGSPVGHKVQEGDERTPEGVYSIDARNPESAFHRSLRISYPNREDKERAVAAGVDPGGLIMIHGIRNGLGWIGSLHRLVDWTDGCIAVTNSEMDEIWASVEIGTRVEIEP